MTDVPLPLPIFIPIVCVTTFIICTVVVWCIKRRLSSHIIHHRVFTLDTIPHVTSCTIIDIETEAQRRRTMSLAEEMDRADRERASIKVKERELDEKTKQDTLYNREKERSQHQLDAYRRELLTDSTLLPHISPTLPSTSPIIRPIDRTTDSTGSNRFEFSPDGVLIITPVLSSTSTTISTPTSPPVDTQQHVHPLLRRITPEDTSSSFSITMSPQHTHRHVTSSGTVTPHEEDITISPLHQHQHDITHHHRVMSSLMLGMSTHQAQPLQMDELTVVIGRPAQISVG